MALWKPITSTENEEAIAIIQKKYFNPWLVLVFDHQGTCEQGGDYKHMNKDQSDSEQEWN